MKQFSSQILKNQKISNDFYQMEFSWIAEEHDKPLPGNFLTIRASQDAIPLLRRPFAFCGYDPENQSASIIYQKRGRGTELLSAKSAGDHIDIIGPLGNHFLTGSKEQKSLLIAGGIGLGPILFLSETLKKSGHQPQLIFGCRNKTQIPSSQLFEQQNPIICTDDGSEGFSGTVADYLRSIRNELPQDTALYCCGPTPMLKACHLFCESQSLPCQVSIEQIMACGVGACMGCVVKIKKDPGYARACKDGPVFMSSELLWD